MALVPSIKKIYQLHYHGVFSDRHI